MHEKIKRIEFGNVAYVSEKQFSETIGKMEQRAWEFQTRVNKEFRKL